MDSPTLSSTSCISETGKIKIKNKNNNNDFFFFSDPLTLEMEVCELKSLISNQQKKIEELHNVILGMQSEMSDMKDVIMHTVSTPLFVAQPQSGNSTIA